MARPVDADYLTDALSIFCDDKPSTHEFILGIKSAKEIVEHTPSYDAVASGSWEIVTRQHGGIREISVDDVSHNGDIVKRKFHVDGRYTSDDMRCPFCKRFNEGPSFNYCSNCGVKLDGCDLVQ